MKSILNTSNEASLDLTLQSWEVRLEARLVMIGSNLLRESSRQCMIREISRTQALVTTLTTIGLNDHVFLEVLGEVDVIGCAILHCSEDKVWLRFLRTLTSEQIFDFAKQAPETNSRLKH